MEKIIYSDTLNRTEFLRTLAKRGIKTLGLRVMSSHDLALYILSKLGKTKKGRYLSNQEQDFIYYSLLKPNSFNDASNKVDADKEKQLGKYGSGLTGLM